MYSYDVDPTYHFDARGRLALHALAVGLRLPNPRASVEDWSASGYSEVFNVLENDPAARQIASRLYDWIVYEDDYPPGAVTWSYWGSETLRGTLVSG